MMFPCLIVARITTTTSLTPDGTAPILAIPAAAAAPAAAVSAPDAVTAVHFRLRSIGVDDASHEGKQEQRKNETSVL